MSAGAQRLVEGWKARPHSGTVDVFRDYNELVRKAARITQSRTCVQTPPHRSVCTHSSSRL